MLVTVLCASRRHLWPVMPRRGSYFFLLVQAKVTKKKDTPFTAPFGSPLRCSPHRAAAANDLSCPYGHRKSESPCGKLALRAQTVLADTPLYGCATRRCRGAPKTKSTPSVRQIAAILSSSTKNFTRFLMYPHLITQLKTFRLL